MDELHQAGLTQTGTVKTIEGRHTSVSLKDVKTEIRLCLFLITVALPVRARIWDNIPQDRRAFV